MSETTGILVNDKKGVASTMKTVRTAERILSVQ